LVLGRSEWQSRDLLASRALPVIRGKMAAGSFLQPIEDWKTAIAAWGSMTGIFDHG
jgi:hypothetical protein